MKKSELKESQEREQRITALLKKYGCHLCAIIQKQICNCEYTEEQRSFLKMFAEMLYKKPKITLDLGRTSATE